MSQREFNKAMLEFMKSKLDNMNKMGSGDDFNKKSIELSAEATGAMLTTILNMPIKSLKNVLETTLGKTNNGEALGPKYKEVGGVTLRLIYTLTKTVEDLHKVMKQHPDLFKMVRLKQEIVEVDEDGNDKEEDEENEF